MTQLCFASTELAEHFSDGASLDAAVQQLIQLLRSGRYLDDFRSLLMKLGRRRESHGNELDGFGLEIKYQDSNRI